MESGSTFRIGQIIKRKNTPIPQAARRSGSCARILRVIARLLESPPPNFPRATPSSFSSILEHFTLKLERTEQRTGDDTGGAEPCLHRAQGAQRPIRDEGHSNLGAFCSCVFGGVSGCSTSIKSILNAVIVIVVLVWLLKMFGLWSYITHIQVGQ